MQLFMLFEFCNLLLGLDTAVASNMQNLHPFVFERAPDEYTTVTIGWIFLATHKCDAVLLSALN